MTAEQVKKITDFAIAAGLEDYLVIATDNEYIIHHRSDTSVGMFDHGKEIYWAFRTNNDTVRNVIHSNPFLVEGFSYDHIVSITIEVSKEKALELAKTVGFDANLCKAVFDNRIGEFQATNYLVKDKDYVDRVPANVGSVRLE